MEYNELANLNIKVSNLGLGCLQLGGHGWGTLSESEMVVVIHEAIDNGITFFDTAPIYGLGHSEEILGRILGEKRNQVVIATKAGLQWKKNGDFEKFIDASPESIKKDIDASLQRLRTDYIDLYQLHWPDPNTPIEETLLAMARLKKTGKIRCIGLSNFSLAQLEEARQYCRIDTIQVPYNLIDRKAERDLLPFSRENDIAVIAYSPIARGLLSGKYDAATRFESDDHRHRNGDEYFNKENLDRNLEIVDKVTVVAEKLHKTPAQISLRWVMENPAVTITLFGAKNVAQVRENIQATAFTLSKDNKKFLSKEE